MPIAFTREVSISARHTSIACYLPVLATWVLALALAGFVIGYLFGPPDGVEPELVRLLRLMALVKLGMVAGATWLVAWRLSWPCDRYLVRGYLIAVALMTIGPGLIWSMSHPVVAFGLFHAGLVLGLILAFQDKEPPRLASFSGSEQRQTRRRRRGDGLAPRGPSGP